MEKWFFDVLLIIDEENLNFYMIFREIFVI